MERCNRDKLEHLCVYFYFLCYDDVYNKEQDISRRLEKISFSSLLQWHSYYYLLGIAFISFVSCHKCIYKKCNNFFCYSLQSCIFNSLARFCKKTRVLR